MAPGTRTPNGRKLTNECAGLPRDLRTELPAKTIARLRAVFCLPATAEIAAKHQTQEHWSQAFNAKVTGTVAPAEGTRTRQGYGVRLTVWLRAGYPFVCLGTQIRMPAP